MSDDRLIMACKLRIERWGMPNRRVTAERIHALCIVAQCRGMSDLSRTMRLGRSTLCKSVAYEVSPMIGTACEAARRALDRSQIGSSAIA